MQPNPIVTSQSWYSLTYKQLLAHEQLFFFSKWSSFPPWNTFLHFMSRPFLLLIFLLSLWPLPPSLLWGTWFCLTLTVSTSLCPREFFSAYIHFSDNVIWSHSCLKLISVYSTNNSTWILTSSSHIDCSKLNSWLNLFLHKPLHCIHLGVIICRVPNAKNRKVVLKSFLIVKICFLKIVWCNLSSVNYASLAYFKVKRTNQYRTVFSLFLFKPRNPDSISSFKDNLGHTCQWVWGKESFPETWTVHCDMGSWGRGQESGPGNVI